LLIGPEWGGAYFVIRREERRGLGDVFARCDVELQTIARDVPQRVRWKTGIDHIGDDHRVDPAFRNGPAIRVEAPRGDLCVVGDEETIARQDLAKGCGKWSTGFSRSRFTDSRCRFAG